MHYLNVLNKLVLELRKDPLLSLRQFCRGNQVSYANFRKWTHQTLDVSLTHIQNAVREGKPCPAYKEIKIGYPIELTREGVEYLRQYGTIPSFLGMYDNLKYVTAGSGVIDTELKTLLLKLDYEGDKRCQHHVNILSQLKYGIHYVSCENIHPDVLHYLRVGNLIKE